MTRNARPWPIPVSLILQVLPFALFVMGIAAAVHAGAAHWIQGANYLAAALPLALSLAGLIHARRSGNKSARLYGAVYLATFWVFCVYSWQRVKHHKALLVAQEVALAPTIAALAAHAAASTTYPESLADIAVDIDADDTAPPVEHLQYTRTETGYRLQIPHSIVRMHVYEPGSGWRDEGKP